MWAQRRDEQKQSKPRTKAELKEAILNVLGAKRGRVLSSEELAKLLPVRRVEEEAFRQAFQELVDERKIKNYIGLP